MSTDYSLLKVYTDSSSGYADNRSGGLSVTFRFYQNPPNISGGGGGWQSVQRPQDAAFSAWRGPSEVYTMELNLIMDTFTAGNHDRKQDIESDCRTLELMYGALTSPVAQPPLLILDANGALQNDVYNFPPLRWVIADPPVYADVLRNSAGRRVRQVVTIKFMKYTPYDELTRRLGGSQSDHSNQFLATARINTFRKAAAHFPPMHSARWGSRLALLNGKHDATAKLLPGRWYRLPTRAQFNEWQKTPRR
jgi:hypothetical protein